MDARWEGQWAGTSSPAAAMPQGSLSLSAPHVESSQVVWSPICGSAVDGHCGEGFVFRDTEQG
jgi:hypothetical protein